MDGLVSPLLVLVLTNVLFGAVASALLLRWVDRSTLGRAATVLLGLGLAPFVVTWILYVLLAVLPGISSEVVIAVVVGLFAYLAWVVGTGWRALGEFISLVPARLRDPSLWFYLFFLGAMIFGSFIMLTYKPLVDHDILEYGTQGRIFLRDMAVHYEKHHFDAVTGFYYVGLHGFSFPLLFTWEGMVRGLLGDGGDAWVRFLTPYYALLLVSFVWATLRRFDVWVAVWASGAFALTIGFLYLNTIYHVDPMRLFLFTASFALFLNVVRAPSLPVIGCWGFVLGAHAMVHSLGMILAPFMLAGAWLFMPGTFGKRTVSLVLATAVFMVAGGIHYVLDILIGTGWLFKEITWF